MGTVSGSTYTTGTITNANGCNVSVTFPLASYTVTASTTNGAATPVSQTITSGYVATLTLTPATGYSWQTAVSSTVFSGSCSLCTLSGSTYTTDTVTVNCNITVTFQPITSTVTASATGGTAMPTSQTVNADSGGTIDPNGTTTMSYGATKALTITSADSSHFLASVGRVCGGTRR